MTNASDPGTGRRRARAGRIRVRTVPPGLLLIGGDPARTGESVAPADLIALARAARKALDPAAGEPPERA